MTAIYVASLPPLSLMSPRKFFCTFPQERISEPIISHTLGEKFGVVPNIRAASIDDAVALVAVEIEGDPEQIEKAVAYLVEKGVKVEEMAADGENPSA
ncbi:MAG TPA: NIL domain-containing protein [Planctomycetota bacterium]|nr:NIL domain-containing protein [Planctomycetota bacterium]